MAVLVLFISLSPQSMSILGSSCREAQGRHPAYYSFAGDFSAIVADLHSQIADL
jgi:hypothetical protein